MVTATMRSTFRLTSSPARIESLSLRFGISLFNGKVLFPQYSQGHANLVGMPTRGPPRRAECPRSDIRSARLYPTVPPRRKSKVQRVQRSSETDKFRIHCFSRYMYLHRITLSAHASTFGGIVRPIYFAVFRLITSSNFVGCSTGRAVGLAPFKV